MIQITKNNYYRPHGHNETFTIDIDPATREPMGFGYELIENAKEIYDQKQGPLYILYSGGIDSELVIEVFLSQKMDIVPVIVRMLPNYNSNDLEYAFKFCKKRNIKPLILDMNLDEFVKNGEMLQTSEAVGPAPYQMLPILNIALKLDGTVISGNNEPYFGPDDTDNKWYLTDKEYLCVWNRLYEQGRITGTPSFLSWSAETMLAFCLDPTIEKLGNNQLIGKRGTYSSRNEVYSRYFPLEVRPKFTGWEITEKSELFNHPNIQYVIDFKNTYTGIYKKEYNQLVQHLKSKI